MKTREEYLQELAQHRAAAEAKAIEYNAAMLEENVKAAKGAETAMEKAIADHNEIAESIALADCAEADNPMIAAVTALTYKAITKKDTKEEGLSYLRRSIEERDKYIDLKKLHKRVDGGIGADKSWIYMVEQLNMQITAATAATLGYTGEKLKEISDSYAMSKIAAEISFGKTPCSNTRMLKTLQTVVSAMLGGEYKATSHDVAYLKRVYSKMGKKALSVSCANHNNFRKMMANVCHHLVTGRSYEVEYKQAKA